MNEMATLVGPPAATADRRHLALRVHYGTGQRFRQRVLDSLSAFNVATDRVTGTASRSAQTSVPSREAVTGKAV